MLQQQFSHIRHWVFDLDNTLYPPSARLFDQIEVRMTRFVMEALDVDQARADQLRTQYWRTYGTTLAGLMREHQVDPTPYLTEVHEISLDTLDPDPELAARLTALPGQRIVYTNGSAPYARRVLAARGLDGVFDAVFGVEDAGFHPKPERSAFEQIFGKAAVDTKKAVMFEDDPRNLHVPHQMGMRTVLVGPDIDAVPHIHHQTQDLSHFLAHVI